MNRTTWEAVLKTVPAGLTIQQVARRLNQGYRITHHRIREFGYQAMPGHRQFWTEGRRRKLQKVHWARVNWSDPNWMIARRNNVSREVVRRRRKRYAPLEPRRTGRL